MTITVMIITTRTERDEEGAVPRRPLPQSSPCFRRPEVTNHASTIPYATLTSGLRVMPQVLPRQVCHQDHSQPSPPPAATAASRHIDARLIGSPPRAAPPRP